MEREEILGIIYYTCLTHRNDIEQACRKQLLKSNLPIVSVSRNQKIDFGTNFVVEGERGPLTMHKQILRGLEESRSRYVYFCESDVLYHSSHFDFLPSFDDVFYYNTNVWKWWYGTDKCVWTDNLHQVSGVCANRELLLDFYTKRVEQIEKDGFNRHYEPGHKQTVGSKKVVARMSELPNVCIRHDSTLTISKQHPDEFRNKQYAKGWKESTTIPGWGRMDSWLK